MHYACTKGQTAVVTALLQEFGADPKIKNANGLTPLHIAAECGYAETVK